MKKIKNILLIAALLLVAALLVWKFVINKPTKDFSDKKPEASYSFADLIKKIETDTAGMRNKLISVKGNVKTIIKDSNSIRIEMGYDTIMSSVTCDVDFRHVADFNQIQEGSEIDIKGVVADLTIDAESVFGNTIQMTYCTLNKK